MPILTLRAKMIVAVSLLVTTVISLIALLGLTYFEQQIERNIGDQQYTLVSALAKQFDDQLRHSQRELVAVASLISASGAVTPESIQRILEERKGLEINFDNGLYFFSAEGTMLAGVPRQADMLGKNFAYRKHIQQTLESRRPQISEPFFSVQAHGHPILVFTAPVLADDGRLVGILGGSLDLLGDNVLAHLISTRTSNKGDYLYLFDQERRIILHPDRSRILQQDVPPGANPLFDQAIEGFEGSGRTVNSRGIPMFSSFKRLATNNWILAANYPEDQAFASLYRARASFFPALAASIALSVLLVFLLMSRLTRSLQEITRQARQLAPEDLTPLPAFADAEIATLVNAFNQRQQRLAEQGTELREQVHFLQVLLDSMPNPIFYKDAELNYLGCNRAFETFIGINRADLLGKNAFDIAAPELAEVYDRADRALLAQPETQIYESVVAYPDGTRRNVIFYKAVFSRADGGIGGLLGTFLDITERKAAEAALEAQKLFSENLLQNSATPTFVLDRNHRVVIWNRACEELTGFKAEEILGGDEVWRAFSGQPRSCLADLVLDSDQEQMSQLYDHFQPSALIPSGIQAECWVTNNKGIKRYLSFSAAPICNPAGEVIACIETLEDLTERKLTEKTLADKEGRLQFLAHHDQLTGLPNRILLEDRLRQAIARCQWSNHQIALLFLDLDRFKTINNALGHGVGDQLLRQVATLVRECLRSYDTVARFGGDEFVIVLDQVEDPSRIADIANAILQSLHRSIQVGNHEFYVSTSIGISIYPQDGTEPEALLSAADIAMYRSKANGGNCFTFSTAEMNARSHKFQLLETNLRRALEQNQLILHYQPQIDLASRRMFGVEALIRWQHPEQGMVSPADFIPLAEDTGLIVPLGRWVLETACRQAVAWQQQGYPPLRMAVNISGRQFKQPDFVDMVDDIVAATGIEPSRLELEITESVLMENVDQAILTLTDLRVRGYHLSIDDFGTGYSSLSYLKRLPISKLKIDRSFVRDLTSDSNDAAIVASIIALTQSMELAVIAEGIEEEEQVRFLLQKGCMEGQGYLFSKPLSSDKLQEFMDRDRPVRGALAGRD